MSPGYFRLARQERMPAVTVGGKCQHRECGGQSHDGVYEGMGADVMRRDAMSRAEAAATACQRRHEAAARRSSLGGDE